MSYMGVNSSINSVILILSITATSLILKKAVFFILKLAYFPFVKLFCKQDTGKFAI